MRKSDEKYSGRDVLRRLLERDRNLLGVVCRFGLSFGFGDKTVRAACADDGVDCDTFLAVANFVSGNDYSGFEISLRQIMGYLRNSHTYFLDFLLPAIRRKLIEAVNCTDVNDIAFLLLKFYDDYVQEVHNHMNHENDAIFSYVDELLEGRAPQNYRISEYSLSHESMAGKLAELKDIFIYHYHIKENEILTSALTDIIQCGEELTAHCEIENRLFIPAVEKLERQKSAAAAGTGPADENAGSEETLTAREKEVVRRVAKGLSNKQIADEMFLSVHTVTTYRRNISAKLNIHSPSGLTIYAILHNLVDINDLRLDR